MYAAIDRKPENGAEIQNSACGGSSVMLRLKLVKTAAAEHRAAAAAAIDEADAELQHEYKVLMELVDPWKNSGRIVCADSYFASVSKAKQCLLVGLRFIGVVKTATRNFPMSYLQGIELESRGQWHGLVEKDQDGSCGVLYSYVWIDRYRRYFITNTSSPQAGTPYSRTRLRQVDDVSTQADPERVTFTIPQPKASEIYYETCGLIDRHNRSRQDNLMLERKIEVKEWSKRVNLSILGVIIVDSFLVYRACVQDVLESDFYNGLAEELIDNDYDVRAGSRRQRNAAAASASPELVGHDGLPRAGVGAHLTPTKEVHGGKAQLKNQRQQGKCIVCQRKTTETCSTRKDENPMERNRVLSH